jgi:hypothetical protein
VVKKKIILFKNVSLLLHASSQDNSIFCGVKAYIKQQIQNEVQVLGRVSEG